jgi:ribosomal protein S12 methylthiotransferase accessory factor
MRPEDKIDLRGTVRACRAEETLRRIEPHFTRFGITRYADVTRLDCLGIPVVVCVRPNSKTLAVTQGKGTTLALAVVSAVMESTELYHSERLRPTLRASLEQLEAAGRSVVHPGSLGSRAFGLGISPRLDSPWIAGTDLNTGQEVLIPFGCASLDSHGYQPGVHVAPRDSNGLASGNHYDEAILHSLCEVIERDCEWRFSRLPRDEQRARLVDQDSIDVPFLRTLLERIAAGNASAAIWDMTSELGIPAYRCGLLHGDGWRSLGMFCGTGCHPSSAVALSRALTEAAQCRLTRISGARDDMLPMRYRAMRERQRQNPSGIAPRGTFDFHSRRSLDGRGSFAEDWAQVVAILVGAGFRRAVAVDLSLPDVDGVAVTKVVVPGLRRVA